MYAEYHNENRNLFSICAFHEVGGKTFLFSHAGVHPVWLSRCSLFDDIGVPHNGKAVAECFRENVPQVTVLP